MRSIKRVEMKGLRDKDVAKRPRGRDETSYLVKRLEWVSEFGQNRDDTRR